MRFYSARLFISTIQTRTTDHAGEVSIEWILQFLSVALSKRDEFMSTYSLVIVQDEGSMLQFSFSMAQVTVRPKPFVPVLVHLRVRLR